MREQCCSHIQIKKSYLNFLFLGRDVLNRGVRPQAFGGDRVAIDDELHPYLVLALNQRGAIDSERDFPRISQL